MFIVLLKKKTRLQAVNGAGGYFYPEYYRNIKR